MATKHGGTAGVRTPSRTEHRKELSSRAPVPIGKIHAIIHGASVAAAGVGVGLAQVPFADIPPLMAIQSAMVVAIGKQHGVKMAESAAEKLIGLVATRAIGVGIARQLVGWFPGIGNAIKGSTAAAMTEALGWSADAYFRNNKGG